MMSMYQENAEEKLRWQSSYASYSACMLAGQGHETEQVKTTPHLKCILKCVFSGILKHAYILLGNHRPS